MTNAGAMSAEPILRVIRRLLCLVASTSVVVGCASSVRTGAPSIRPAVDVPEQFLVVDGADIRPARASEGCRNPMTDPRDGTRLELARSANGQGDYAVPGGRYGVDARSLLRLECSTGRPLGVVPRPD